MGGTSDTATLAALGRISRSVAHDFNNALTSILSSAELLAEDTQSDDPRSRDIARIRRACLRARALTVQLLEMTESRPAPPRELSLVSHIEERKVLLERAMGNNNRIVVEGDASPEIRVDVHELDNVLLRLAINAGLVMSSGQLKFEVAKRGEHVVLSAVDQGKPVQERELAFIYDPSVGQLYTLASCYTFMTTHGGSVDIESSPSGNRVTLRFPVTTS